MATTTRQLNFNLPKGYEKISGAQYPTRELQLGAYSNVQPDPTNTFLYGQPNAQQDQEQNIGQQQPQQQTSPIDNFNLLLTNMLSKAQGVGSADLLKKQRELQRASLGRAGAMTPEALRTLSPSQQAAIRSGKTGALSGELDTIAYEIKKAENATKNFEFIFDQARQLGEDFQSKMIAPDAVVDSYVKLIETDPSLFNNIASKMNEKTFNAVIAKLDYSKLAPKEDLPSVADLPSVSERLSLREKGLRYTPSGEFEDATVQIPASSRIAYEHNNPGNLMFVGQVGATQGEAKSGGGFWAKFETPEAGYSALKQQIELDKSRGLTLGQFIGKYAPPSENQTLQYISDIGQMTGFGENAELTEVPTDLLAQAIAQKESGTTVNKGTGELSPEQELQARNLAVEIFGKRAGAKEENISLITNQMAQGKSADEIKDTLKLSGQSLLFSGAIRDAAESISFGLSEDKQERFMFSIDRSLEEGNMERVKDTLIKGVFDSLGTTEASSYRGDLRAVELFSEIEQDLITYENAGGNTNIFKGSHEKVLERLGTMTDPFLAQLANKIQMGIQKYRKAISGAAFTESESIEYKKVFPNISNTKDLNVAKIQSAKEVLNGNVEFIFKSIMGADAYEEIFNNMDQAESGDADPLNIL